MKHLRRVHWIFIAGAAVASLATQGTSPHYTIAFKAFPPSNTDIFIAAADGSNGAAFTDILRFASEFSPIDAARRTPDDRRADVSAVPCENSAEAQRRLAHGALT